MKGKRYSDEQIVKILNTIERSGEAKVNACRKAGISEQTYYRWRNKFHGMATQDVRRLRELERENGELKKRLAERCLEVDVLKEIIVKKW